MKKGLIVALIAIIMSAITPLAAEARWHGGWGGWGPAGWGYGGWGHGWGSNLGWGLGGLAVGLGLGSAYGGYGGGYYPGYYDNVGYGYSPYYGGLNTYVAPSYGYYGPGYWY